MLESKSSRPDVTIRDPEGCSASLKWYKDAAAIDKHGGKRISFTSLLQFFQSMVADELLQAGISSQPDLPERAKRRAIDAAVTRWIRYKKYRNSPDHLVVFKDAYSIEVTKILALEQDYRVLVFLNLDPSSLPRNKEYRLWENAIKLLSWPDIYDFDLKGVYEYFSGKARVRGVSKLAFVESGGSLHLNRSSFTPLQILVRSYSPRDALGMGVEVFDLLRACINFVSSSDKLIQYGNLDPICKFMPSPFYAVYASEPKLLDFVYPIEEYTYYRQEKLSERELQSASDLISILNRVDHGLSDLFRRILFLYQQALDQVDHRAAYLALWQVAEACVLDRPNQHTRVDRRIAQLTGLQREPLLDRGLALVNEKRNALVHSGAFPQDTANILFSLKKFVDIAISSLLDLFEELDSEEELEEYLTLLPINSKELKRRRKAVEMVLASR